MPGRVHGSPGGPSAGHRTDDREYRAPKARDPRRISPQIRHLGTRDRPVGVADEIQLAQHTNDATVSVQSRNPHGGPRTTHCAGADCFVEPTPVKPTKCNGNDQIDALSHGLVSTVAQHRADFIPPEGDQPVRVGANGPVPCLIASSGAPDHDCILGRLLVRVRYRLIFSACPCSAAIPIRFSSASPIHKSVDSADQLTVSNRDFVNLHLMGFLGGQLQRLRSLIPVSALPALARRRVDSLWQNEEFRSAQEAEMQFLLEYTDRAPEIPELARGYTEFALLRGYRRWHPGHLSRQPVNGAEWLTTKRDPERGILLSFLHHAQYDGLFASLARHGVALHTVVAPEAFDPASAVQLRQHFKVAGMMPSTTLVPATIGTAGMVELLEKRAILAIASDVAGRTPVQFLGRELRGSFGAARIATQTTSPVVLVTSHRGADGSPWLQVHEPLEPGDFADPADLLAEVMRRHEPAVLAWPEAFDSPYGRLGIPAAQ